jgi:hypothetical protein
LQRLSLVVAWGHAGERLLAHSQLKFTIRNSTLDSGGTQEYLEQYKSHYTYMDGNLGIWGSHASPINLIVVVSGCVTFAAIARVSPLS